LFAEGELADKILGISKKLSEPYGTRITKRKSIGIMKLV
jgi:hypothetical protein